MNFCLMDVFQDPYDRNKYKRKILAEGSFYVCNVGRLCVKCHVIYAMLEA